MMLDNLTLKEKKEIRFQFLYELYKASNGRTNEIIQMWDIGETLKLDKEDIQSVTDFLKNENQIKHATIGGGISLTHDGLLIVEDYLEKNANLKNKNDRNFESISESEKYQQNILGAQKDEIQDSRISNKRKRKGDIGVNDINLQNQGTESLEMENTKSEYSDYPPNDKYNLDKKIDSVEKTYLLAYDPKRFEFSKMRHMAIQLMKNGRSKGDWSCGQSNLPANARVFLIRHGEDNPGIIASGSTIRESHEGPHWDPEKKSKGEKTNFVDISWDTFRKRPLLPLKKLEIETGEKDLWIRRENGMRIKPHLAKSLEAAWKRAKDGDSLDSPVGGLYARNDIPPCSPKAGRVNLEATEQDCLDISTQAKAFSTLLTSKDVNAPIAIALLGDWGVGKTHFMRIMQETVQLVTNKESKPTDISVSVSRAVQIEFNAWHYVDTDLWASLASHIFDELAQELESDGEKPENVRLELRKKIHSSSQEMKKAEAAVSAAKEERKDALDKLERAKNKRTDKIQNVWNALISDDNENKSEQIIDLKNNTNKIVKNLGFDKTLKSAKDVENIYNSLQDIRKRGQTLVGFIDTLFSTKRIIAFIFFSIFIIFSLLGFPLIVDKLDIAFLKEGFSSLLIQITAVASPIIIWTSKNINSVSKAMGYLESIQEVLNSPPSGLEKMKSQIEECDATILTEEQRVKESEREIARVMAEIQRINSGGLVYDFIKNKKSDSRYIKRMGLISVIRKDFEELKTLLADWNKHNQLSDKNNIKPIERIILYIDDLDRCPTQRVVEVLQAVHLLLAFDLFNVVVAVDARWLERSLNEAYNPSKVMKDINSYKKTAHRFSAHNYLEKIFQVPFSLPSMEKKGYQDLIENLVVPHDSEKTISGLRDDDAIEETGSGENGDTKPNNLTKDIGDKTINTVDAEKTKEPMNISEQEANDSRIQAMKLFGHEKIFISALYKFIPTPRLANRFVNIYRLLRVRAESLNSDMQTFLNQENGEYRATLLLLAINIGYPKHAPELFEKINNAENDFLNWLTNTRERYIRETNLGSGDNESGEIIQDQKQKNSAMEYEKILKEIEVKIDKVIQSLVDLGGTSIETDMNHYIKWAKEVNRYSFH